MNLADYLIKEKILTKRQVLEAFAYQQDRMPSLFQLAFIHTQLSEEKLLKVASQLANNQDFIETVRREALLSEKNIRDLLNLQGQSRMSLGQALVAMGVISPEELRKITLEYSSFITREVLQKLHPHEMPPATPSPEQPAQAPAAAPPVSASPLFVLPEFQFKSIDADLVTELAGLYDETKKTELETAIMKWPRGFTKEDLRVFYRELHTLKGTARFLGAFIFEFVVHHMENLLSDITRVTELLDDVFRKRAEDLYLKGLDLTWELRASILEEMSEEPFSTEEARQRLESYIHSLSQMQQDCLELESQGSMDTFKDQF